MRITITALLLLLSAIALPAQAENSFSSAGETGQWIMQYYQNPEPERLADALLILAASPGIPEDGQKLIFSFMGAALAQAPGAQDAFFQQLTPHKQARLLAFPCFWFMGNDDGKALIQRAGKEWEGEGIPETADQFYRATPPKLLDTEIQNALHLDHLWSTFFATGKAEPVLKIISALALINNEDVRKHVTGQTAQWSLKANARVHPVVRDIIQDTILVAEEPLKSALQKTMED